MSFVSITRLRVRAIRFLPAFAWQALRTERQVRAAPGFRGGALLPDRRFTFWTLTVWDSAEAMRAYITSGAHRVVMPKLMDWCDEASIVHWEQTGDARPDWAQADARMRAEGRPSKVRHPTPDHLAMTYAAPRTGGGTRLTPTHLR
ncbi:MAG: DUF3291 domain-containing protein [Sphingomonadales bacterium]|nr:MAG: DUF3291 domain-containing protein [Sphingomonadales bacterium]